MFLSSTESADRICNRWSIKLKIALDEVRAIKPWLRLGEVGRRVGGRPGIAGSWVLT